jgi:hypothetical protein
MGWTTKGVVVGFQAGAIGLCLIKIFQTGSGTHPASCSVSFGVNDSPVVLYVPKVIILVLGPTHPLLHWVLGFFLRNRTAGGAKLNTLLHLMSKFRKSGAVPMLPLYVFMTGTGTAVTSTLFLTANLWLRVEQFALCVSIFFSYVWIWPLLSLSTLEHFDKDCYGADIFPELTKYMFLCHLFTCAHCCCKFCCVVLLWKIYTAAQEMGYICWYTCWYTNLQNWFSDTDTICS